MSEQVSSRQFMARLRDAGWSNYGQGHYRHVEGGGSFNCFDAPGGIELWRFYAENDLLPDPEGGQAEQHKPVLEAMEVEDG